MTLHSDRRMQWFRLDVDTFSDPKVKRIKRKHGVLALALIPLFCELYKRVNDLTVDHAHEVLCDYMDDDQADALLDDMIAVGLLTKCGDVIANARVARELEQANARRIQASEAGRASAQKRGQRPLNDRSTTVEHQLNDRSTTVQRPFNGNPTTYTYTDTDTDTDTVDSSKHTLPARVRARERELDLSGFDQFWEAFGKKRGRREAEVEWSKLTPDDRAAAMAAIPAMVAALPEPRFRKDPERWLKHRRWEDDYTIRPKTSGGPNDRTNTELKGYDPSHAERLKLAYAASVAGIMPIAPVTLAAGDAASAPSLVGQAALEDARSQGSRRGG